MSLLPSPACWSRCGGSEEWEEVGRNIGWAIKLEIRLEVGPFVAVNRYAIACPSIRPRRARFTRFCCLLGIGREAGNSMGLILDARSSQHTLFGSAVG